MTIRLVTVISRFKLFLPKASVSVTFGVLRFNVRKTSNRMPEQSGRGSLIVFEGLDRSGKSTQFQMLSQTLRRQNLTVKCMRFPDRSGNDPTSVELCQHLADLAGLKNHDPEATHQLFTKQRRRQRNDMVKLLEEGTTLVVDRYSHSGVAYSAAKDLSVAWCKEQESGLIMPDLVLFLDILPEEAEKRGEYGNERYEHPEFQHKVYKAYNELREENWKVISATLPVPEIASECLEAAIRTIRSKRAKPLGILWPPSPSVKPNFPTVRISHSAHISPRKTILQQA